MEWEAEQLRLEGLLAKLEEIVEEQGLDEQILISLEERGLVVRFLDSVLFDLGSAELREDALEILASVVEVLKGLPNHIRAEGHTDDLPINTYRYPSNWELSSARATSVIRALLESYPFPPAQLGVAGYGEYRPIAPNQPREAALKPKGGFGGIEGNFILENPALDAGREWWLGMSNGVRILGKWQRSIDNSLAVPCFRRCLWTICYWHYMQIS